MDFSIEGFWKKKFSGIRNSESRIKYAGWSGCLPKEDSYVQARLSLREGFSDLNHSIWLVAAPGAVGKSTLAKQICAETGATYLDLAAAATVGGSYITGGLVHAGLIGSWMAGEAALVVDALDEARLKVTQPAFEDFLKDIVAASKLGKFPIVLLGRVGIIEEAWSIFNDVEGVELPILNVELFSEVESEEFVRRRLKKLSELVSPSGVSEYPHLRGSLDRHEAVYSESIKGVLHDLRNATGDDASNFVGYAPVLDAIATVIATEKNPSRINEDLRQVLQGDILKRLSGEVLRREKGKLVGQLEEICADIPSDLYSPDEQLERLACRVFKMPEPPVPNILSASQASAYLEAIKSLLPQHPFLDGSGASPSSAVFEACIIAHALKSKNSALKKSGETYSSLASHAPNPFLYDFYGDGESLIEPEHIGLIFESVLARSKSGDLVSLSVDEGDKEEDLSVEIFKLRSDGGGSVINFNSENSGVLQLGRRISHVNIDAPELLVSIGAGDVLEVVAPTAICCSSLELLCKKIYIKGDSSGEESAVSLEADSVVATAELTTPIVRAGSRLSVTWPSSSAYPWTEFSTKKREQDDSRLFDLIRVFRRLVMAFRSHSKGRLARFKDKIEHARMLKGIEGRKLLETMMSDGIISLEGPMYYLDANALGARVGTSFLDVNIKNYSEKTIDYLRDILLVAASNR